VQPPDERAPSVMSLPDDVIDLTIAADDDLDEEVVNDAIPTNVDPGAGATTEISNKQEAEAHAHATRVIGAGATTEISNKQEGEAHAHATRVKGIDPRIRARRVAVAREQGRRRLRVVMVVLTLFVVFGSAWLVVQSPMLDVDHIVVTGIPPERVAAVIAASGVHRRDPLLLVHTGAVERRVEQVPGIGAVTVTRELPGTLHISASEQGVALWARVPGGVALIGFDGRVQRIAIAVPPHVIELRGLARVPDPGEKIPHIAVTTVMSQLPPVFAARVGAVSAVSTGDVRLYLVTGGEVRLGDLESVHDKGVVAEAVIERMACALTYVDVRSISNPVALPAPGATCN
jgi:cell division septal protein FtsQ